MKMIAIDEITLINGGIKKCCGYFKDGHFFKVQEKIILEGLCNEYCCDVLGGDSWLLYYMPDIVGALPAPVKGASGPCVTGRS